jgi:hypothetical protein
VPVTCEPLGQQGKGEEEVRAHHIYLDYLSPPTPTSLDDSHQHAQNRHHPSTGEVGCKRDRLAFERRSLEADGRTKNVRWKVRFIVFATE